MDPKDEAAPEDNPSVGTSRVGAAEVEGVDTADGSVPGVADAAPDRYRWVAMGVVLFGTFMVVLDTTVVNLGLPSMVRDFKSPDGVEWVVTAYLAAVGVAQMASGWIADRFGRKNAFISALVVFTAGSILCAASPTLLLLVAARVVQGIGGGILMPVAMAMIYELFAPDERGRAMGYFGIAVMAAPAIGPVLGGGLVESVGWHWLFLINVPIGMVGLPIAVRVLRDSGVREKRPFDRLGLVLSGVGLALFMVGLSLGGMHGWVQTQVLAAVAVGVALLVWFVLHALRSEHPLVDIRILGNPVFAVGMVSLGLLAIAQYCRLVYIPLELGTVRGVAELTIGFVMLPSALGIAAMMPVGGRLADRVGARIPATIGTVLLAISFWPLAHLTADTSLLAISGALFLGGLGSGMCMMAPNIVALNAVPAIKVSQASGLSSVSRQTSAAVGTAVLASIYASIRPLGDPAGIAPAQAIAPFNTVFMVGFGVLVVGVVVAQFLPGKAVALRLQDERREEQVQADTEFAVSMEA